MKPNIKSAYKLIHDGILALSEIESNGIRIDTRLLDKTTTKVSERIEVLQARLQEDQVWKVWKRRYGTKSNLDSRPQLASVLFEDMGYESQHKTATGRYSSDEGTLAHIDSPFVKLYLQLAKLKKLKSTYLRGISSEVVDGFLRPSFNLHLVETFRSSSSGPNFQNLPIRDPKLGKMIRRCFIPRKNHVLVEIDYSALEYKVITCLYRDPNLIAFANDSRLDMHRDMAKECYMLTDDEVTKETRFYAKNQFVFPIFYGSYYVSCARNLWDSIGNAALKTKDGTPLFEHLQAKGIRILGNCNPREKPARNSFEGHIKQVEEDFNERFPTWDERRHKWYEAYQKRGYFDTMTGFRCSGVLKRNHVFNYPIQGPAFHCLLWSLIQLVKRTRRMKTKIVGQIHDSIIADVHESELVDYVNMAREVMTQEIRKHWSWIIVPLLVEVEMSATNWWEKKAYESPTS